MINKAAIIILLVFSLFFVSPSKAQHGPQEGQMIYLNGFCPTLEIINDLGREAETDVKAAIQRFNDVCSGKLEKSLPARLVSKDGGFVASDGGIYEIWQVRIQIGIHETEPVWVTIPTGKATDA